MNSKQPHRRYCRCRRYCPEGNIVSYRTFARHKRQEKIDREQSDGTDSDDNESSHSSDADDENSDSDGFSVQSIEPLFPMALPEMSPELSERGSVDSRQLRTASPFNSRSVRASSSATPSTERADGERADGERADGERADSEHSHTRQNSLPPETGEDLSNSEPRTPTPAAASPPGSSPPPFENIEEAIFSNFDIEDLLFASQIEVEPWLRLGIVLLRWKCRKNISTHAFDELRHDLAQCVGMNVPSSSVIIRHLQEIVGIYPRKIDCCANGCLAYVGRYRNGKKCAICGEKRFQLEQPGDDDVPDLNLEDSDVSDEDIEDESQVCFAVYLPHRAYSRSPIRG
jgi:hypothetical protein